MPGQGCEIGIPLLHNDLPQCANTWINPAKSREMRTDVRAAHEIGPRKRRGGKKWECQRNPACSRGRIRNEWGGRCSMPRAEAACAGEIGEEVGSPPISRVLSNAAGEPATSGNHSSGRHVTVKL